MIALYVLCFLAGVVLFAVPGKIITFRSTPTHLIIERKQRAAEKMAKEQDKIPLAIPEAWLTKYPGAIFKPAMDDLTGASVFEVDVKDWAYVRMLELNIWGCYWHTRAGEYLPAGITPDEEAAERPTRAPRPLTAAERNEPAVVTANGWWEMKMAEIRPVGTDAGVIVMHAAKAELDQEDPPYPWGAGVTKRLRDADVMLPPIERMLKWDYTQNDNYLALTVHYEGGTIYRAIRNHAGVWNVTVGSLADLTNALIASGIVS